ncbi:MAG: hypothetical protein KJ574_03620 [Nanoarchaeota archaeon]|nr:hypothetical protein [Nanoarchaeota archaeon]
MAHIDFEDMKIIEEKKSPCESCKMFESHGKKCWFYWANKKECSQHTKF